IGASFERLEGEGADLAARLPGVLAAFHDAGFERVYDQLGILDEEIAGLILIDAETVVFDARQSAAHPENHPADGEMIEHRDLLGDANRIVPWQHDHPRAALRL